MLSPINDILLVLLVAVLLTAALVLTTAPPPHERAWMWLQGVAARVVQERIEIRRVARVRIQNATNYWAQFQREVLAELGNAPQLPPIVPEPPNPTSVIPPLYLYYGAARRELASIYARGLAAHNNGAIAMFRSYGDAQTHAVRHAGREYVVFRIHSQRAYQNGIIFERNADGFTAAFIHPEYLDFHWLLADLAHRDNVAA